MPINGRTPTPPTQRELSLSQHTPSYPAEDVCNALLFNSAERL
jgi:hypothetical protein